MENETNENFEDLELGQVDDVLNKIEEKTEEKDNEINLDEVLSDVEPKEDYIKIPAVKFLLLKKNIARLEENFSQIKSLLAVFDDEPALITASEAIAQEEETGENSFEGVFDGEKMIASNGEAYPVPVNYSSKSKLVEGDILKMTITNKGMFLFKQISPIERKRLHGVLAEDEAGNFWVVYDNQKWRILTASVTFFKGRPGDITTILVPKEGFSRWAAVEHIKRSS